jgi:tRNA 2-thiouridine synthesizing protein D
MATFTLLITSNPNSTDLHIAAVDFARAAILGGHSLRRVFFYADGVYAGLASQQAPQGQESALHLWRQLKNESDIPLQACIANAIRRGVTDAREAKRYNLGEATLADCFELSGLGEMAVAFHDSDRIIQF